MADLAKRWPKNYGSHLPVLMKLLPHVRGNILELGTGLYSTPFLHWYCLANKLNLVSIDNDPKYFEFVAQYEDTFHKTILVDDWDKCYDSILTDWSVVLIDHAPSERRVVDIEKLMDYTDFMVIHDTYWKMDRHYNYKQLLSKYKYRKDFPITTAHTSVCSNKYSLEFLYV